MNSIAKIDMDQPKESLFESERLLVLEDPRPLRVIATPRVFTGVAGVGVFGIHAIAGVGCGSKARLVEGNFPLDLDKSASSQIRDAINTMTEMLAPFVTENTCSGTVDPAATEVVPAASQPEAQPGSEAAETASAEAPKKRGRRTKAQIEADNAAAAAAEAAGSSKSEGQPEAPADPVKTGGFVPQVMQDPPPSQARGVTPPPAAPPAPPAQTVSVPATESDPEIPSLSKLETVVIPYGANKGKTLGSVPIKNIEWYANSLLAAYIKERGPHGVITAEERAFIQSAKDLLAIKRGGQ